MSVSIPSATAAASIHFAAACADLADPMEIAPLPSPDAPESTDDLDGTLLVTTALDVISGPLPPGDTPAALHAACAAAETALSLAEAVATRGALLFRLGNPAGPDLVAVSLGDGRIVEPRG